MECSACGLGVSYKGDRVGWKAVQLEPNNALSLVWFCMTKEPCQNAYLEAIQKASQNWGVGV